MKVANKIRHPWKHFFHRRDNSFAHIMHERYRLTVLLFNALEEGDEQFLFLWRNFDSVEHQLRDPIKAAK